MFCPKCDSQMLEDKHFEALGSELELVLSNSFRGDKLKVYYCENCGYIETYRDKKRSSPMQTKKPTKNPPNTNGPQR